MGANAFPQTNVTKIPVYQMIEYSFRELGLPAEMQTPQYVEAARQALQYTLQELPNNLNLLWQYRYTLFGSNAGTKQLVLPEGAVDVIEANYRYQSIATPSVILPMDNVSAPNAFSRNLDNVATTSSAENYLGGDYGASGYRPTHVGINAYSSNSNPVTYGTLVLEYSLDGITWQQQQVLPTTTLNDRAWQYWEIDGTVVRRYWRIRSNSITAFSVRQVVFGTVQQDIPLYRLNKDDYYNLPNRVFQSVRALQYWFDRQVQSPVMYLWPVPQDDFQMFQLLLEVQMPDVGNLGSVLQVPNRWLSAIQSRLSAKLSLQIASVDANRIPLLQQLADAALQRAQSEERDKSGVFFRPQIRGYTRM